MSRIEELPDDFDDKIDLNKPSHLKANQQPPKDGTTGTPDLIDQLLATQSAFPRKKPSAATNHAASSNTPTAAMPPAMDNIRQYSTDELMALLNRTPLFMTSLDETDGEGGENVELEALKALAYEGTRAEIAQNFREQGNEHARAKNWREAKGYYDQALGALKGQAAKVEEEEQVEMEIKAEVDEEAERKKEKEIEEACLVNRALCNLELKNYRACTLDCASTLHLNPRNIKAYYRTSLASLALDKVQDASTACSIGLSLDPTNTSLSTLRTKIHTRTTYLEKAAQAKREREAREVAQKVALDTALKMRGWRVRYGSGGREGAPDMEDAVMKLSDVLDAKSTLSVPVLLLYPLHSQTDLIKSFSEHECLNDHLEYILPLPWDTAREYGSADVECYMEVGDGKKTTGLVKAGRKMALGKILGSGKVEVVDGLVRCFVVPREGAAAWVREWKERLGRG